MNKVPTAFLRLRLLALFLLSLAAVYGEVLALEPWLLRRPLEMVWPPVALGLAALGGVALQDRMALLAERAGRGRLQMAGWLGYGFVLLLVVMGLMSGETGRDAVRMGTTLMRILQPAFLLLAGLGRSYLGAITNAFAMTCAAGLGGGPGAAVAVVSHAGLLVFFLVADHHARKLAEYPVEAMPPVTAAMSAAFRRAGAMTAALVGFFAVVPPQPFEPLRRAGRGAGELPRETIIQLGLELAVILFLAGLAFYVVLRLADRRGRAETPPLVERVATRRGWEPSATIAEPLGDVGVTGWRARIVKLFVRMAAQLSRWGIRRRPDHTPREYARQLAPEPAALELAEIFVRARYGPEEVTEEDFTRAARANEAILDHFRRRR